MVYKSKESNECWNGVLLVLGFTHTFGSLWSLNMGCLEIIALPKVDKGCIKLFRVYTLMESSVWNRSAWGQKRQTNITYVHNRQADEISKQGGNIQNETDTEIEK